MGILLCEQNFRDVWRRNKSVRAEIGKILRTHTHTRGKISSKDNIIFYVWCSWGLRGVWGGGGWVSVDRRLFHRCGASVDLELSYLETLLSLEVKGSSEGILYDEIYIFCMCI